MKHAKPLPPLDDLIDMFALVGSDVVHRKNPITGRKTKGTVAGYVWQGPSAKTPYRIFKWRGKHWRMHRIAYALHYGVLPEPHEEIDHVDGNGLNNAGSNLRVATTVMNRRNMPKPTNSSSVFRGVYWRKEATKWCVRFTLFGKNLYLGHFASLLDAVAARLRAEREHNYHANHGRKQEPHHA